jgi:hypothetical protein
MKETIQGAPYKENAQTVVATDEAYTIDNFVDAVDVIGAATITLPSNPTVGQTHRIIASGGDATVVAGGDHTIVGQRLVEQGTSLEFSFTYESGWLSAAVAHAPATTAWFLAPSTGSDENDGLTDDTPKATLKGLAGAMGRISPRSLMTVDVLENVTDATDFFQLMSAPEPTGSLGPEATSLAVGTGPTAPVFLKIRGTRTTSTFTDPNTSSTTALTMTEDATPPRAVGTTITAGSNGAVLPQATINVTSTTNMPTAGKVNIQTDAGMEVVAYTGKTATTLTGCTGGTGTLSTGGQVVSEQMMMIFVTGFDFSSHVGKHIEILTSPIAGAVGMIAGIARASSSGVAELSPLQSFTTNANLAAASYVGTNGTTFRIYELTTWAAHLSPGLILSGQIEFEDMDFTSSTANTLRGGPAYGFRGCVIRRPIRSGLGGEPGPSVTYNSCITYFAAPAGGRAPTQLQITTGENRFISCVSLNVDFRPREANANVFFVSCVNVGSSLNACGPNDAGRIGGFVSLSASFPSNAFGTGWFDWPAPDLLAPAPGTTRASTGAAITLGHCSQSQISHRVYGNCSTANTVMVRVREGARLLVTDAMTEETSPVNGASPTPNFIALTLGGCGTLGQLFLDEDPTTGAATPFVQPTHVTGAELKTFVTGGAAASARTLKTWKQWRADFGRNAVGLLTGASILNIAS